MLLASCSLLAFATLVLGIDGAQTIRGARRGPIRRALHDCGFGFAASATTIGLAMLLAAPTATESLLQALGFAAMLFGAGLLWAAACRSVGGVAPRPAAVAAGAIGWLGIDLAAAPSLGWRIAISAALFAAYAVAAVSVAMQGRGGQSRGGFAQRGESAVRAARALVGRALGRAPQGSDPTRDRGAGFGMDRAPAIGLSREPTLEDALTGVGNQHALSDAGAALIAEASASGRPLALLLMDVDCFKALLARHGGAAGERLLVAFARLAHDYLPPTSLVCRLDGDVFAAVLPGAAPERALVVADELRSLFAHLALDGADGALAATVSIGIAQARPGASTLSEVLDAAVRSLSAAKAAGRNFVLHEAELPAGTLRTAA